MTNTPLSRRVLALFAIAALTLAACSGSSSETSGVDPERGEVSSQAVDDASGAGGSGSEVDNSDAATIDGGGGVPDWYVCTTDTFLASSIPVSVVGARTPEDEELGGIFAAETVTPLTDSENSHCEIFYGSDPEALRGGNLAVVGIVGGPSSTSRLFENFVNGPSEPETIGTVQATVTNTNSGVGIYFEVDGAGVILTVDSFLAEHDENEARVIGIELAELVVAAASSS